MPLFLLFYFIPIQQDIERTEEGLLLRFGQPEYEKTVNITIQGVYKKYLFKPDEYTGRFAIDAYGFTIENENTHTIFTLPRSSMAYFIRSDENDIMSIETLGTIISNAKLDGYVIQIPEPIGGERWSWRESEGLILVAPAKDKEQAVALAQELYSNLDKRLRVDMEKGLYYPRE